MSRQKHEEILKDPVRQKLVSGLEKIYENSQNILLGFGAIAVIMVFAHFRDVAKNESTTEANSQFGKSQNQYLQYKHQYYLINL